MLALIVAAMTFAPFVALSDSPPNVHAPVQLEKGHGYLIVDLKLARDTGTVTIGRLSKTNSRGKRRARTILELGPFSEGRHFYLLSLPEGNYVWSEISVPHYDLPHRVDQTQDERWSFSVQADQLNYAGQLLVREGRSTDRVSIALLNRIASSLTELTAAFPDAFSIYPLRNASMHRDQFIESFLSQSNSPQ